MNATEIMLAEDWSGEDMAAFLVSEKLDGVRALWDGKNFISRNGNTFAAPASLRAQLPADTVIDGELYAGRGRFHVAVGAVKTKSGNAADWKGVKFHAFDLPGPGPLESRLEALRAISRRFPAVVMVEHTPAQDDDHAIGLYTEIIRGGGEGVILRRRGSAYTPGRSSDMLKIKDKSAEEATVVGLKPGTGSNAGKVGSYLCELDSGVAFSVGLATNQERRSPRSLGDVVTVEFQGLTPSGAPRHPVLLCARNYE